MATLEQYAAKPNAVDVFAVGSGYTDIILRKNIIEIVVSSGESEQAAEETAAWQCEERQMRIPTVLTAEQIISDFDTWWDYEPTAPRLVQATPTMSERLAAVEAAVLELGEVLANG